MPREEGLEAFLDLCDADLDWDSSEDEIDPFERLTNTSTQRSSPLSSASSTVKNVSPNNDLDPLKNKKTSFSQESSRSSSSTLTSTSSFGSGSVRSRSWKSGDSDSSKDHGQELSFQDLFGDSPTPILTKRRSGGGQEESLGDKLRLSEERKNKEIEIEMTHSSPESSSLPPQKRPRTAATASSNSNPNLHENTVTAGDLGSRPTPGGKPIINQFQSVDTILDPQSKLRLIRSSITFHKTDPSSSLEGSLKSRNLGQTFVGLSSIPDWWTSSGGGDGKRKKEFWTTGVIARRVPGIRRSAKGNEYLIWEVTDLLDSSSGQNLCSLFLFCSGGSMDSKEELPVGTIIDILRPSPMGDPTPTPSHGKGKNNNNNNNLKLCVNDWNQIKRVGISKDFGLCGARKDDGKTCSLPVNKASCPVCIFHASRELRKMNGAKKGGKAKGKVAPRRGWADDFPEFRSGSGSGSRTSQSQGSEPITGTSSQTGTGGIRPSVRMELQDPNNTLKRSPVPFGNHPSISFKQDEQSKDSLLLMNHELKSKGSKDPGSERVLDLDPSKTRHLTEKDRKVLESLGAKGLQSELPHILASTPNAGARNILKHLASSDLLPKDPEDGKFICSGKSEGREDRLVMTQQTLLNMKKALNYVQAKGPIQKKDPNKGSIRKVTSTNISGLNSSKGQGPSVSDKNKSLKNIPAAGSGSSNRRLTELSSEGGLSSKEMADIWNAKSSHEAEAEEIQSQEYFETLERKEAVENKLLSTFSVPTNAIMCRVCKVVVLSQSQFCKDSGHVIRVVKAIKRFFKCKDCGRRTMSLDRLPKTPCSNCKSSSWIVTSMGKERSGPKLDSEVLVLRGDEEKFLGSSSSKLFLNA